MGCSGTGGGGGVRVFPQNVHSFRAEVAHCKLSLEVVKMGPADLVLLIQRLLKAPVEILLDDSKEYGYEEGLTVGLRVEACANPFGLVY